MNLTIERVEVLLLIAAVVGMLARHLRVPYSVGLVFAGIGLALMPFFPRIQLTKELIFTAFLPPLIFEAAFQLKWQRLRKELPVVLLLATVGVLLSAAVTAAGMRVVGRWDWMAAIIFGVLIAATDPVSVLAIFKEAGINSRVRLLVEAESLFNDCTAAILFSIVVEVAAGGSVSTVFVGWLLLKTVFGAIACGSFVGTAVVLLMGRTDDHLIEITFTTVAAYGSFLLAEHFHLSGVLATLTAGLIVGSFGLMKTISDHDAIESFWEYAAFIANSLVFLLIGMHEVQQDFRRVVVPALVAIAVVIVGRASAIYPLAALFARSKLRVPAKDQHILFWGGLRGALALALALGLPTQMPAREEIISVAFAVVAFSIFVQGLTIVPLLRRSGEAQSAG